MINGIQLKVCGLTRAEDAVTAAGVGADCLGFIFYPKSPRALTLEQFKALASRLPAGVRRVAVLVEPGLAELSGALQAGFDFFQIHFKPTTPLALLHEWSEQVTPARLWLVPKLPPEAAVPPVLLPLAGTFLLDTFHPEKFGGTGETGDWVKFRHHQTAHPDKTWILSGGLTPENLAAAVRASGAKFVDVNSGVESAPGIKDHAKLQALAVALR
ncbi:MAG: phosphoribosylanthranilate isomerase [Opitutae bacterium]|nr:phosphoribosylanthranilate isomerase [Opitutae bacterium]